jgi:2-amino-4-hydroxy-6-hydroxymethyldihydropteridine diphosphokinase
LGSNIGDKFLYIEDAILQIGQGIGVINKISPCYETEAWGPIAQEAFVNCVIEIESNLTPGKLLKQLLHIERLLGRERQLRYGPRTIDLDILLIGNKIVQQKKLNVPHPFLQERKFVLIPLCDLAPQLIHPIFNKTMRQLLGECQDDGNVNKLKRTISL